MRLPYLLTALLCATTCCGHAGEVPEVGGLRGAIPIPLSVPADGIATVALYTSQGRMVRILAQGIPVRAGPATIRWDGMDLWGNLLPAGTQVVAKTFTGPGPAAIYEFAIASSNPVPWPTKPFGDGAAQRTGGWLGDHGVTAAVVAAGDRLIVGSFMAEHGHTLAICNLDGDKLWGRGGLEGWNGPGRLASDGQQVFAAVNNNLHRFDLDGGNAKKIGDTGKDTVLSMAAHDGKMLLVVKNQEVTGSVVAPQVGTGDFIFASCLPVPNGDRAYNRNLNGQEQFAATFFDGVHPQAGTTPAISAVGAGVVAAFKKPVAIGTLVIGRPGPGIAVEAWAFKPGTAYDAQHSPEPGELPDDAWERLGVTNAAVPVSTITAPRDGLATAALYLRYIQPKSATAKPPRLDMCRILPRRLERLAATATVQLPPAVTSTRPADPGATAWTFDAKAPITKAAPVSVLLDYGTAQTSDAILLLNCVARSLSVDAWTGSGQARADAAEGWTEVATHGSGSSLVYGSFAAGQHSNDTRITFKRQVDARWFRLRFTGGLGSGRFGSPAWTSDASRCDVHDVALLRLATPRAIASETAIQVRSGTDGKLLLATAHPSCDVLAAAWSADGAIYTVSARSLNRSELPKNDGGVVQHAVLASGMFKRPTCIAVSPDGSRIAVGDDEADAVFIFDRAGKQVGTIGGIGPRKRGPWDPRTVDQPRGVTIDRLGKVWVCEGTYTPKRLTRYTQAGAAELEILGPPHYGGGGWIDTSLTSFWYEACEYAVDFSKGTSRLKNLNDVQSDPMTPTSEGGSYNYTRTGRPVRHQGRRYLVGDAGFQQSGEHYIIVRFDEGQSVWKPAAVMGKAQDAVFLTREDKPWSAHWLAQDLADRSFIWCDLNGDGQYQVDEVQLFTNESVMGSRACPFTAAYFGSISGGDLTFWGACRLAPRRFTDQGVPVFDKADIRPFDYAKLAPVYMGNIIANQAAKAGFGGALIVAKDGSAAIEGQPYVVLSNLTIKGGPVTEKPTDYIPRIAGMVLDNPLSFVGSAMTTSTVGEVALMNGDNGRWFVWSVQDAVVLGEIFTGKLGGFGGVTDPKRGQDMTGYKQDWETFFGSFIKADNGKYYAIAGRGHHGLFRIDGLDQITVASRTVTVPAESVPLNAKLRADLVAAAARAGKRKPQSMDVPAMAKRVANLNVDGRLDEWGDSAKFQKIPDAPEMGFDAAWSDSHLVLAYRGVSGLGNNSEDPTYIFKTGFCFDLMVRSSDAKDKDPVAGDRRIVFARHKGAWVAMLYDYVTGANDPVNFTSPVTSTRVDRVVRLPADAVQIALAEGADQGPAGKEWTAEVRIAWKTLGIQPSAGKTIRADIGILSPDSGGIQVEKRSYWSDPDTLHVADLAVEAQIHPGNWGTFKLMAP